MSLLQKITLIIIRNNNAIFYIDNNKKCFLSSNSVISEGSRDTEDWSNDAENSALITRKKDIKKKSNRKHLF